MYVIFGSSGSPIDCSTLPLLATGMIGDYNTTTVSSVIVYQCQQEGFAPSVSSSVCGEDGRWSPDPSQVVCAAVRGTLMEITNFIVILFDQQLQGRRKQSADGQALGGEVANNLHM